jgi:outer membrane protein assembly factor BamB
MLTMHARRIFLLILFASLPLTTLADWPSWRGPDQNGTSAEKGLISEWSQDGLNLIWKSDFIGRSTPIVMNGRVYVIGRTGTGVTMQEHVACFDAKDGKKLWEKKFSVYHSTVPFSRCGWASLVGDPETGNVYMHGVGGLLVCFDKDGKILWEYSLTEDFGHVSGFGGRTDTPVIDEDVVIQGFVNSAWGDTGAVRHRFYAFDKRTGEVRWISSPGVFPADFNIYSTPVVAVINGQRLLIGGNGDGAVYALKVRTGEKAWGFQLGKRGLNSSVVVDGTKVCAAHSEENMDEATMGRVVCIDGTGTGDVTKTNELWRYDKLEVGYTSPALHEGRLYVVDNSANIYALDASTGKELWKHNLGTVGKGSPVWADGKIYVTEVNGTFVILQPGASEAKVLDAEKITVKGTRPAEIYGSPAIAYGRIYFETEEGLYCLGNTNARFNVDPPHVTPLKGEGPVDKNASPAAILVVPAEVLLKPGDSAIFKVRSYNDKGQFLQDVKPVWSVAGLKSQVDETGKFVAGEGSQAGTVTAQVGQLKAVGRVRIIQELPITENFDAVELEKVPSYWIGAAGKFFVREKDGKKVLVKTVRETGLQTAEVFIGPASMNNYTIQADVMGAKKGRRMPDVGLLASGYTLDLMGSHQRVQLRSWASELRINQTVEFPWNPDTWYTMKLQVDMTGEKGIIRGKVWPTAQPEPEAWTVVAEDPVPVRAGSPGIYGNSNAEIYYDK